MDHAIATDFVAISKALISQNLNPTCLSGIDLRDVMDMIGFPLVFGREDLGDRTVVYTHQEAAGTRFYHLAGASLKNTIMAWIGNAAAVMRPGDRLVLIFLGPGNSAGDLTLTSQGRTELLSKSEIVVALKQLPRHVRVTIMNESCYSGSWGDVSLNVGDGKKRDVLSENACQHDERSWNYYSSSGIYRCSLFAAAWLNEITTNSEACISHHISRIMEEVDFVPPHQDTNKPVITTSSRSLRSFNTSHFILPPNIASAIINTASDTHERQLQARSRARQRWRTLWSSTTTSAAPGAANSATEFGETDLTLIKHYLDQLGAEAQSHGKSGFANVCLSVLQRGATDEFRHRVVKTIIWIENQNLKAYALIRHLVNKNFLGREFEPDAAETHVRQFQEEVQEVVAMLAEVPEIFHEMQASSWDDGCLSLIHQDAFQHLVHVFTCNKLLMPKSFDAKAIISESLVFLQMMSPADPSTS